MLIIARPAPPPLSLSTHLQTRYEHVFSMADSYPLSLDPYVTEKNTAFGMFTVDFRRIVFGLGTPASVSSSV